MYAGCCWHWLQALPANSSCQTHCVADSVSSPIVDLCLNFVGAAHKHMQLQHTGKLIGSGMAALQPPGGLTVLHKGCRAVVRAAATAALLLQTLGVVGGTACSPALPCTQSARPVGLSPAHPLLMSTMTGLTR